MSAPSPTSFLTAAASPSKARLRSRFSAMTASENLYWTVRMGTLAMREWLGRWRRRRGDLFRAGSSSVLDAAGALDAAGRTAADLNSPMVKPPRTSCAVSSLLGEHRGGSKRRRWALRPFAFRTVVQCTGSLGAGAACRCVHGQARCQYGPGARLLLHCMPACRKWTKSQPHTPREHTAHRKPPRRKSHTPAKACQPHARTPRGPHPTSGVSALSLKHQHHSSVQLCAGQTPLLHASAPPRRMRSCSAWPRSLSRLDSMEASLPDWRSATT